MVAEFCVADSTVGLAVMRSTCAHAQTATSRHANSRVNFLIRFYS
jgi:hypothetical protein